MRFSEHLKKASLVGAFFVFVIFSLQAQALCSVSGPLIQAGVAKVLDGDTLRLADGRSVRLIGINTPEIGRKGRSDQPYAVAARTRLQALIEANDRRVGLLLGSESKDGYGRLLAHAFDERGENLEAALLAEGLGYFVAIAPNTLLTNCHRAAERYARSLGKGLWRKAPVVAAGHLRQGGFAVVRARVERLEKNRGGIWLETEGSLVLQVPHQVASVFTTYSLADLPGKTIEVRGWVIDRKPRTQRPRQARWMLRITHPSMLDPLP